MCHPCFLVLLSVPTGWLYDLWAGKGTEQGQWPGADVQQLRQQKNIESCFFSNTPVTVNGCNLVACPLARLRDTGQAGVHIHNNSGVKRSVSVSEYIYADYPLPPLQRFVQGFVGGYYNRYYLAELEDGSWLCVYFDDYLLQAGNGGAGPFYGLFSLEQVKGWLSWQVEPRETPYLAPGTDPDSLKDLGNRDCRLLLKLPKLKYIDLRSCRLIHKEVFMWSVSYKIKEICYVGIIKQCSFPH